MEAGFRVRNSLCGLFFFEKVSKFMLALSYNQKAILNLYERFYNEKYPSGSVDEQNTTQIHINSQKMCYLLKMYGVNIGDFCFTWNFHGPFSPGLLAVLRSLDRQKDNIEDFYSQRSDLCGEECLFDDNGKIEELINLLDLRSHSYDLPNWMELLGSFVYLSNSVFPYEDYTLISNELKKRKNKFSQDDKNLQAWQTLLKANLLKIR